MRKVKIYKPSKTATQSGYGNSKNWILEFETLDPKTNHLMGWELSKDTFNSVKMEFSTKENAIDFAKKNKLEFKVISPNKKEFKIKSYADNFLKN
tara:strand:- start:681 stop:965 length:285 start_codon:yes stop_codon:yes gene_type:complete